MGFDIDINLKWFHGITKPKKPVITEHAKLCLVVNWVKFSCALSAKRDNLTFQFTSLTNFLQANHQGRIGT